MNDEMLADLLARLDALEARCPSMKLGVVTTSSPLAVAIAGASTPSTNCKAAASASFTIGDVVMVAQWRGDLFVLDVIA
jgi:hypothetical protein